MVSESVFVIDLEGTPLLPTHPARARKLLSEGKATVAQMVPFTLQLQHVVEAPAGKFTIGVDDGAKTVGIAVVDARSGEVVLTAEIDLRQDVPRKVEQRKSYRRTRRSRTLRYRAPRPHRKRAEGWLAPTIRQKKDSIVRVVQDLQKVIHITAAVVEQGQFDIASLVAGRQLSGVEYQIPNAPGRDFRAKVLWRDHYTCQHCDSKSQLQAHHIRYRSEGGSDTPENGLTLCVACHAALHNGQWQWTGKLRQFQYPAHLQIGKHYLVEQLTSLNLTVETCLGWMTSYWRQALELEKTHANDAIAMVCRGAPPRLKARHFHILPKRKKVWDTNPTKTCTEKNGFRYWDLVKAAHRTRGQVIGCVRSLKKDALTLRTAWNDNFPVAYRKAQLLWRFDGLIYI